VNQGVTLGAVNLPEVNLRSLTMDEPNHARVSHHVHAAKFNVVDSVQVIYIHRNVPGVLKRGKKV